MTWEQALTGVLGVSVTLNVGLLLRANELSGLREVLAELRVMIGEVPKLRDRMHAVEGEVTALNQVTESHERRIDILERRRDPNEGRPNAAREDY